MFPQCFTARQHNGWGLVVSIRWSHSDTWHTLPGQLPRCIESLEGVFQRPKVQHLLRCSPSVDPPFLLLRQALFSLQLQDHLLASTHISDDPLAESLSPRGKLHSGHIPPLTNYPSNFNNRLLTLSTETGSLLLFWIKLPRAALQ